MIDTLAILKDSLALIPKSIPIEIVKAPPGSNNIISIIAIIISSFSLLYNIYKDKISKNQNMILNISEKIGELYSEVNLFRENIHFFKLSANVNEEMRKCQNGYSKIQFIIWNLATFTNVNNSLNVKDIKDLLRAITVLDYRLTKLIKAIPSMDISKHQKGIALNCRILIIRINRTQKNLLTNYNEFPLAKQIEN